MVDFFRQTFKTNKQKAPLYGIPTPTIYRVVHLLFLFLITIYVDFTNYELLHLFYGQTTVWKQIDYSNVKAHNRHCITIHPAGCSGSTIVVPACFDKKQCSVMPLLLHVLHHAGSQ
mmetsp:Transcript_17944/g.27642  ORF Transcript_17944/g.27642 Transcript_17944/m.27642 type:complete len:116 (-) Transcript_17944:998-1345(-)